MRPAVKLGKHVEERDCFDRISSLHDDLLVRVLSFLPTKYAVRTSILSTRWRYLFTLTPCLSFDDAPCLGQPGGNDRIEATRRFKEFVDKVLELHRISPIQKFSLVCRDTYEGSDLNRWFSYALQKGVEELHYHLSDQGDCAPEYDGFFTCETLVSLKMIGHWHYIVEIPRSASLPKLKVLHLSRIIFYDFNSLERLFSSCESLEELSLVSCECDYNGHVIHRTGTLKILTIQQCSFYVGTLEIDAPNLAYLTYSSNIGVKIIPSWENSSSFVRAELKFRGSTHDDFDTDRHSVKYDRKLLKAAAYKATKLCFEMDSVQFILTLDDDEQMPDFPSLSRLHVGNCPYEAWRYVTSLIDKSPKLETVVFESGFRCCYCSHLYYCSSNDQCYCDDSLSSSDIFLDSFSCRVELIEVYNFCGHKGSLSLTGHLLRNASFLKKLIVYRQEDVDLSLEHELKISQELLMLTRASKDCCVEVVLESDSETVVDAVQRGRGSRETFGLLVDDILAFGDCFVRCIWSQVKRDGNTVAHHVARLCPRSGEESVFVSSFPDAILALAEIDLI